MWFFKVLDPFRNIYWLEGLVEMGIKFNLYNGDKTLSWVGSS
jgi:hypothetical protein